MSIQECLLDLADPAKRLTSQQLVDFSDLDAEEASELAEAWPAIDPALRLRLLSELTDLAQDNIELNFEAVFKNGLGDEDAAVRVAALRGLYEYEGRDIVDRLAELLRDDESIEVRREAAIALGRYTLTFELGQLNAADGESVRSALIEAIEDEEQDDAVRARAVEALGALSDEETTNLIESIYREESLWLRVGAIDAMGRSCSAEWLPVILRELENPAPEMRHAAVFAAGEIGEEEAIEPLSRAAVGDPDAEVQRSAVHALGEIGGATARVALNNLLYEGGDSLREAIDEALSEIAFQDDPLGGFGQ